jgi:hypothetical protein
MISHKKMGNRKQESDGILHIIYSLRKILAGEKQSRFDAPILRCKIISENIIT